VRNDPFQAEVAQIALRVSSVHGFALGGGQALVAHGIVDRPTEDVDLFTDIDGGVSAAADTVRAALEDAGLKVIPVPDVDELAGFFEDFELGMTEWEIHRGDRVVRLTLARLERKHSTVVMDIGPVMHIDDVIGSKVAAVASRAEVRDFIDLAAALDRYSVARLISLARSIDPGLSDEEFAAAGRRLDAMSDRRFLLSGLTGDDTRRLRLKLARWPRSEGEVPR